MVNFQNLTVAEQKLVVRWAVHAPQSLIDRLNYALDCHRDNYSTRMSLILDEDIKLRLEWSLKLLCKIGMLPSHLDKSNKI